jgi:hypothetical protein
MGQSGALLQATTRYPRPLDLERQVKYEQFAKNRVYQYWQDTASADACRHLFKSFNKYYYSLNWYLVII